jgi:hypothetical protein
VTWLSYIWHLHLTPCEAGPSSLAVLDLSIFVTLLCLLTGIPKFLTPFVCLYFNFVSHVFHPPFFWCDHSSCLITCILLSSCFEV